MKMKTVLVLTFAVGCGLVAMMGVQQMISKQSNQGQEQPVQVLVATTDISPGVLLSPQNCEFKELPAQGIPSDAVRTKEQYHERGLLVPVMAGDIIRMTKLGNRGDIAASASIPNGMRTVSIQVNDTKTHSGLLQPGDRVDLQVTYEYRTAEGNRITKSAILLEYIEVFASDAFRNLEAGESKEIKAKNITLLVTPEQANYIQLANTKGELIPIMRSKTDKTLVYPNGIDEVVLAELRTGMEQDQSSTNQEEEKAVVAEPVQSFKEFLNQPVAEVQPMPEPEPVKTPESWTITIYAGDDVITQDVALPVGFEPDAQSKPGTSPAQSNSVPVRPRSTAPSAINPDQKAHKSAEPTSPETQLEQQPVVNPLKENVKNTLKGLFDSLVPSEKPVPQPPMLEDKTQKREARSTVPALDTAI